MLIFQLNLPHVITNSMQVLRALSYSQIIQDVTKKCEFKKEVGIAMKVRKQVATQLETTIAVIHQPASASVGLNIHSQMHVQIMYSLSYLKDLITTLTGIKYISEHTKQSSD